VHFSYQESEKKEEIQTSDHRRQSNHYPSTRVTQCEKGHCRPLASVCGTRAINFLIKK
jgi:hypothetical protein